MSDQASPVRTVDRICDVLNCFTTEQPIHSLTALSGRLGLPKSTLHRLLGALEARGLITRDLSDRGYRLGYQLLYWGLLAQEAHDLRQEALPVLHDLANTTGETAILSIREAHEGICLEKVDSTHPVRLSMRVGQRLHLHAGASAKVLLAFLPDAKIWPILDDLPLVKLAPNTLTDRDRLREDLAAARARGYTTSYEETDGGAMGIAAPVYDHSGTLVAGIGIAAPLLRASAEAEPVLAPLVVAAGRRLSERLGARRIGQDDV